MILKKPYAFLIKNFKKINLILAITMSFVLFKTFTIYRFFRNSAANNYYATLAYEERNLYVNFFVLFVIVLIIGALVAIYYLLNHKNKPRKFYMYSIVFYVILFVYYLILAGVFKSLIESTIEMQAIRAYQDISFIAMLPQIGLIIYSFITAMGVTLKKFNFAADLKDEEINASDNEEVEFDIKLDGYKTRRKIRRTKREFTYYVKENMFIISCIGIGVGAILGFIIVRAIIKGGGNLLANQNAVSNKFTIRIEDSIISNLKPGGDVINDKYYVVVRLYIKNISNTKVSLDYSNYHLIYKKKNVTPTLQASQYFYDYAFPYLGDELSPNEERTIALAFEIDKADINSSFLLKTYKGSTTTKNKLKSNYNEVKLKPKKQMDIGDASRVTMGQELNFNSSNVGNTKLTVNSYSFNSSYKYTYYDVCDDDNCDHKTDIITPDYLNSKKSAYLMILEYNFDLDKNSIYSKYDSDFRNFVTSFLKIKYVKNGQTYYSQATSRTTDYLKDVEVIQIDRDVIDADEIQLVFTIRNRNYIVVLK